MDHSAAVVVDLSSQATLQASKTGWCPTAFVANGVFSRHLYTQTYTSHSRQLADQQQISKFLRKNHLSSKRAGSLEM
jgi:hypothetical protein